MSDTQWPRFEVFKQDSADQPLVHVGSVHAADAELAMMNARDVFVRRPACVTLWVVRADFIVSEPPLTWTDTRGREPSEPNDAELFHVFEKAEDEWSPQFARSVRATSPSAAIREVARAPAPKAVFWAFADCHVSRSDGLSSASWFEPAATKRYRDQAEYDTEKMMRAIRQDRDLRRNEPAAGFFDFNTDHM